MPERFRVDDAATTALLYRAKRASPSRRCALVLAHGAGAPQTHPFLVGYAEGLSARGIDVVTFNFRYTEAGKKAPDKNDALEACWMAVLAFARKKLPKRALFLGGKSMGGRIASQIAARPDVGAIAGLVFLGYPLHPPGQPKKLRTAHLATVRAPMLFVQGTRDPFGTPHEIARAVRGLSAKVEIVPIEGGDHSFAVPKRGGASQDEVHARAMAEIDRFIARARATLT